MQVEGVVASFFFVLVVLQLTKIWCFHCKVAMHEWICCAQHKKQ